MGIYIYGILTIFGIFLILIETIISGRWNSFYFNHGIPLFSEEVPFLQTIPEVERIADSLNTEFKSSGNSPSILFNILDSQTIAFREKIFEFTLFHFTPLMHGKISFIPYARKLKVIGLSNWFPILFLFIWYSTFITDYSIQEDPTMFVAPLVVIGIIYYIQRNRYLKIAQYLSEISK